MCLFRVLWDPCIRSWMTLLWFLFSLVLLYFLLLSLLFVGLFFFLLLFLWIDTIAIEPYGSWIILFYLLFCSFLWYVFTCIALQFKPLKRNKFSVQLQFTSTFYSQFTFKSTIQHDSLHRPATCTIKMGWLYAKPQKKKSQEENIYIVILVFVSRAHTHTHTKRGEREEEREKSTLVEFFIVSLARGCDSLSMHSFFHYTFFFSSCL